MVSRIEIKFFFKSKVEIQLKELERIIRQRKISEESIHQLRVNIKRWRVFFDLIFLSGFYNNDIKRKLRGLKVLFKIAGKLRSAQLISKKLDSKDIKRPHFKFKQKIQCLEEKVALELNNFSLQEFNVVVCDALDYFLNSDDSFLKNLFATYKFALFSDIEQNIDFKDSNQIHFVRKSLRKVLDTFYFFPSVYESNLIISLKKVQKDLGFWHDELDLSINMKRILNKTDSRRKKIKMLMNKSNSAQQRIMLQAKEQLNTIFKQNF